MTQYAVTTQPIDGLTLSASYDFGQMGKQDGRQKKEGGSLAANFNLVNFVGYGETRSHQHNKWVDLLQTNRLLCANKGYSIGFANDNLSICNKEESEKNVTESTSY